MQGFTTGSAISLALKQRGVDTVFGIPGVHNVELYRGIQDAGITHVLARHEQGAGFMADGYARATGKPGVAFTITGPGLTNIMTPMGQGYSDSVPMLIISSCLPEAGQMPGQLHQMRDQLGAAASVCDWSERAAVFDVALQLIDRALGEFRSARRRPKHVTIPIDVLGQSVTAIPEPPEFPELPKVSDAEIAALAGQIEQARRPLFIFGGGAAQAPDAARKVLKLSGGAAFCSYAGCGVIHGEDAMNFGPYLYRPDSVTCIAKADLVIVVGCELGAVDLGRDSLGHTGTLVRIDIDETVLSDAHGADVTLKTDACHLLDKLAAVLKPQSANWQPAEVSSHRKAFRAQVDAIYPAISDYCVAMHQALPDDTMYFSDMTQMAYAAREVIGMARPGHWHHPTGFGTLGYALPAAIGGKIARPDLPTVAIAGDYGFQYTMAELGVAAELDLTLPIVLWDNGKLKEIEDCMVQAQIAPNAVVAQNPDFSKLAAAYGVAYAAPASMEQFQAALRDSLHVNGPTIIHLMP